MALGVCIPIGMSGVCSPPIMLPNDADAGVANDKAPLPFPPCPPVTGVACMEWLWGPVQGVTGAFAPDMLECTSSVPADNGVPGMALGPGVAPIPPDSIMPPACVLLLQGASAVRGAVLLLCPPSPKASLACPIACAISTSLKYSLSSSSAPK
jgi:hypothetical protein